MRSLLLFIVTLAIGATTFAAQSPYMPEEETRFNALETKRVARAVYDINTNGGSIAPHGLGVVLPANALVTQVYFQIITQFVDGGVGTVALHCEDANNLYTATDITGFAIGTTTSGAATGAAANMVKSIAAQCEITATVAGAAQTAGRLIVFVEYTVIE